MCFRTYVRVWPSFFFDDLFAAFTTGVQRDSPPQWRPEIKESEGPKRQKGAAKGVTQGRPQVPTESLRPSSTGEVSTLLASEGYLGPTAGQIQMKKRDPSVLSSDLLPRSLSLSLRGRSPVFRRTRRDLVTEGEWPGNRDGPEDAYSPSGSPAGDHGWSSWGLISELTHWDPVDELERHGAQEETCTPISVTNGAPLQHTHMYVCVHTFLESRCGPW